MRRTIIAPDLYSTAMHIVPILLIALFLDDRDDGSPLDTPRGRRWQRVQNRVYALLAVVAFFMSMFAVSDVIESSRFTEAVVITALGGTMTLLLERIWRRLGRRSPRSGVDDEPPTSPVDDVSPVVRVASSTPGAENATH